MLNLEKILKNSISIPIPKNYEFLFSSEYAGGYGSKKAKEDSEQEMTNDNSDN